MIGKPEDTILSFIKKNKTTKREVLSILGKPSGVYGKNKIYTYRVSADKTNWYVIEQPSKRNWASTVYSLVLVFNKKNILQTYSLVNVH